MMKTRSGLGSVLKETANEASEQDTYSSARPPRRKKRRKKKFKPKGVNKKWSRRERGRMCVGGRCGAS
tara:strand:+ start:4823 stop:5026 length:204 start_codon:yes stop_codon:yes gene_type:complete